MSGFDAEIEAEDLAVDRRGFDCVQFLDAGSGIVDAVRDLLPLQVHRSADDEGDDEDERPRKGSGDESEQDQTDDHGYHRSSEGRSANL